MKKSHRLLQWLLTVALCIGMFAPVPVSAADIYFTSINDNLLPLTTNTMPLWSGGSLYVPYSVFDSSSTGVSLGIYSSYSRSSNTVTVFNLYQMLTFDLNAGTCRDEMTGNYYQAKAIFRNNRPYLPLNTVCSFFELERSYTSMNQGNLVRIKDSSAVLTDSDFISGAGNTIALRLREYNQSINPSTGTPPPTTPSVEPPGPTPSPIDISTYLAFLCRDDSGVAEILNTLDSSGVYGLFLFTPQALEEEGDLVRRILGTGHSVGLLAEGADTAQTQALLAQGSLVLEQTLHIRTTVAYVPDGQQAALASEGWVFWNETAALAPSDDVGPNSFAYTAVRQLGARSKSTYLTLEAGEAAVKILTPLLRQLDSNHFAVAIPAETRL